jgi:hypothetical protein
MPDAPELPPPDSLLDLSRFTEDTRRALYDLVLEIEFTEPWYAEVYKTPRVAAERAGLEVFWAYGRWFATWRDLHAGADHPLDLQIEVVRIKEEPDSKHGIMFHGV